MLQYVVTTCGDVCVLGICTCVKRATKYAVVSCVVCDCRTGAKTAGFDAERRYLYCESTVNVCSRPGWSPKVLLETLNCHSNGSCSSSSSSKDFWLWW